MQVNPYIEFLKQNPALDGESPQDRFSRVAGMYREGGYFGLPPVHRKAIRQDGRLTKSLALRGMKDPELSAFVKKEQKSNRRHSLGEILEKLGLVKKKGTKTPRAKKSTKTPRAKKSTRKTKKGGVDAGYYGFPSKQPLSVAMDKQNKKLSQLRETLKKEEAKYMRLLEGNNPVLRSKTLLNAILRMGIPLSQAQAFVDAEQADPARHDWKSIKDRLNAQLTAQ